MYSQHLYCSTAACSAVYEARGPLHELVAQTCAFCGAALESATWPPPEFVAGEQGAHGVRLTLLQEPLGVGSASRRT